jgi:hypothetical protein
MGTSQSKLILYLIVLVGLVGGYLYNSGLDRTGAVAPLPSGVTATSLQSLATLKIDYTAIQDAQFDALRIFGEFPVPTDAPGKTNIFAP